ncbi:hypothetical protein [Flavobacterium terrigena]|uniref:Lipoprotein n=1 Tax=Flavobacterium terrigena TaxID=402734 RepID=A0A1H6XQQ2_9FLAO|nr:hypothetical protein [Flavobacterium terrigena]SEJ29914.1 hypothetical protein SAMN05660918_2893 [Flavobacterium terrigena]
MNKLICFIFLIFVFSCKNIDQSNEDNIIKTETIESKSVKIIEPKKENIVYKPDIDWQENFGLTHDIDKDSIWKKPVRFYVDNPNCDKTAIGFYFGKFRPRDTPETSKVLQLAVSDDTNLRPFYRWILNKTIEIQDGALGEFTGVPARKYTEKFPNEFFEYMDIDPSGEKYSNWYNSILYSGSYEDDDIKKSEVIRQNLIKTMKSNCKNCNQKMNKRIEKFALDCFPESEK